MAPEPIHSNLARTERKDTSAWHSGLLEQYERVRWWNGTPLQINIILHKSNRGAVSVGIGNGMREAYSEPSTSTSIDI